MHINVKTKIKNNYHVQCIDTITGKTKYDLTFHNVVLNQIVKCYSSKGFYHTDWGIGIGSGSGVPEATNTSLFTEIKVITKPSKGVSIVNSNTIKLKMTHTLPANADEVYSLSEVGILLQAADNERKCYVTHAMLADSEGNPITINKTDTDKVILTCELYFSLEMPLFDKLRMDGCRLLLGGGGLGITGALALSFSPEAEFAANLIQGGSGVPGYTEYCVNTNTSIIVVERLMGGTPNVTDRTITDTVSGKRLSEYPMQAYIKGIALCGTGIIKLPNAEVFPNRTLENITIGIGDGITAYYKCPLNYFIKDSETLYVDGNPLIQGVDYTIDNENNQDELVELSAGNDAIITGGIVYSDNYYLPPIFRRLAVYTSAYSGPYYGARGNQGVVGLDNTKPLFFDFLEPRKLNLLRAPLAAPTNVTLELFGRNTEDEEWQSIVTFTRNNSTETKCPFETVTYRYAKLTANKQCVTSNSGGYDKSVPSQVAAEFDTIEKCQNNTWFLGYVGESIKFTTPPAIDAVITMSAQTDLPMLTPNSVLDLSMQFNMTM